MSVLLEILSLLSGLQNVALVQDVEQCVLTNTSASAIWSCILAKLTNNPPVAGSLDHVKVEAAKLLAAKL